jgi:polyhydroxyalkanoate synthase
MSKAPEDRPSDTGPDFDKLAKNTGRIVEEAGKVAAAYIRPHEEGKASSIAADEASDMVKTLARIAESWATSPQRIVEAQSALAGDMLQLWTNSLQRLQGEPAEPVATVNPRDKRFADSDWTDNPYFDFLKQAYLLTMGWAESMVEKAEGLDEHTRHKARFYVRQIGGALSPSNFLATNPELIRATIQENGDNLVRGLRMLAEDITAGKGQLKLRQTDESQFEVGVNLATTPGKVIFRNELFELIQYAPTTDTVLSRPLLIVPPWINKYYVLDLSPEKSMLRWLVSQGVSVFVVSWVNPDERLRDYDFTAYMKRGILAAIDKVLEETGSDKLNITGYCVGGTLTAVTLAWLAAQKDKRIASATFLTTQVDFTYAGDLKVFADEEQIQALEALMEQHGYLPSSKMAGTFNSLRPQDLVWPYIVNNYMKGQKPAPFDLLYWNSDSTRMPVANHRFYLRNCYLENQLAKGVMTIDGKALDLKKVRVPVYNLATKEDHIAPALSVFVGSGKFGGKVRYVMAGSGHIAGVVNPPAKKKYQYWTGDEPSGKFEDWVAAAQEHPGSWWPDWLDWLKGVNSKTVPARQPGTVLKPLGDAPGDYVKMRG